MASFNIVSWNCQGLRTGSPTTIQKMNFLDTQYPTHQFDILALLETHHRSDQDFPPLIQQYAITHHLIHTPMQAP
ncbi:MAG: endonuclease/exonuclease/phosphatase family protein, partial [Bacteroidota bacterium]|nr:endonuclease/exonuclease/phosphatase family protein [Bacteroidota bacterium]